MRTHFPPTTVLMIGTFSVTSLVAGEEGEVAGVPHITRSIQCCLPSITTVVLPETRKEEPSKVHFRGDEGVLSSGTTDQVSTSLSTPLARLHRRLPPALQPYREAATDKQESREVMHPFV